SKQNVPDQLFNLLDDVEYLHALMLMDSNQDEFFASYLKETCERFRLPIVYEGYQEGRTR
ncbi:MAG: hypothetical protein AAF597_18635, partial [Bacteroidota bacterium]